MNEFSNINKEGKSYDVLREIIHSSEGELLLNREAEKHLEGKYSVLEHPYGRADFLLRTIFKKIYQWGFSAGFKDGFHEGALSMEIQFLKEKQRQSN